MKFKIILSSLVSVFAARALANGYLGVVNKADHTASFIDIVTQATEFVVAVGFLPHEIIGSPDGRYAFISNYGKDHVRSTSPNNRPGTTLTMVDLRLKTVKAHLELGTPCAPHGVVTSADGQRLYITCEARAELLVMDLSSQKILSYATGQDQSHMVVVNSDESKAYTSNFFSGSISVLDLKHRSPSKVIATGAGTEGISLSADDKFIFASSVLSNRVVKIDAQTLQIVGEVETERSPVRVLPTPDGKYLVVNCSAANVVQIFSADSLALIKTIPVGRQPIGLAVPNNYWIYSASMLTNEVSEISLQDFAVHRVFKTGQKPDGIAIINKP